MAFISSHSNNDEHANHQLDHDHGNPYVIPFLIILVFAFLELFGGIWTKSLALLGDAWHMFSDVFALGLAMLATHSVKKLASDNKTNRIELIVSTINAILMLVVITWIVYEAIARFKSPQIVAGGYVVLIAFVGLVINLIVAQRLYHQAHYHGGKDNLNHRAALLHVFGDILGSVAALVSGVIIVYTGWLAIDPLLSILISLLLLVVTLNLIKDIWHTYNKRHCKNEFTE